jgi:hypothetical protein
MSLKLKPLPPRESATSLYRPMACDRGRVPSAASVAETRKCSGRSSRPASITRMRRGLGQRLGGGHQRVQAAPVGKQRQHQQRGAVFGRGIAAGRRALAGQLEHPRPARVAAAPPRTAFLALGQQGQAVVVGAQPLLILGRQQRRQHAARAVAAPGVTHRHLLRLETHLLDHLGGHAHLVAQSHTVGRPAQQGLGQHRPAAAAVRRGSSR